MQLERDLLRAFPIAATNISVADAGSYYTGTDVEAALQELGAGTAGPFVLRAGDTMTGNLNITVSTFAATKQGTGIVAPNGTVIRGFAAYDSAGTATAAMGDADIGGGNFVSVVALAPTALQLGATIGVNTAAFADEVAWLSTFDGMGLGDDDVDTSAGKYIIIKKGDSLGGYRFRVAGSTGATEINYQLASTSDVTNSFTVTHTLPTLPASSANAVNFNITSAGSASQNQIAVTASLEAGYTGSSFTGVFVGTNNVAGTATGWETGGSGNYGGRFFASGSTAGENVGMGGSANASTFKNIGTGGRAISNTTGINVGVMGVASNATGVMIGGYFQLGGGLPTLTSAALMCDNGAQTSDIFVDRDNGTSVMSIVDGGQVLIGTTTKQSIAGNTSALLQVATATAAQRFNTFAYYKVDTIGANLTLAKSYNDTLNTLTYVATGAEIGRINFASADESTSRFGTNAIIAATSQEAHTATAKGTKLAFATTPIGSATAGVMMILNSEGSLAVGSSTNPVARLDIRGNLSSAAWGVTGVGVRIAGSTYTDTSSSGTVATAIINQFAVPTLAATNVTTFTAVANVYIAGGVTAGTNATITNAWGLWNTGKTRLDDQLILGAATTAFSVEGQTASKLQISATNSNHRYNVIASFLNGATGAELCLVKSRNASAGGLTYPTSGDAIGLVRMGGANESTATFELTAQIGANADETWTASSMGTRMSLATCAIGGATATVRQVWGSSGDICLGNTATPTARLQVTGASTQSAWGVNGVGIRWAAATYTDSDSTGTVASAVAHGFAAPIFAAASATTFTDSATLYLTDPVAGTNVTLTNKWSLWTAGGIKCDGYFMPTSRILGVEGANVASGTNITLGNGNMFHVTGTTQINTIITTGWTNGSHVTLIFDGALTVKHSTAGAGSVILLAGSVDFVTAANSVLELVYDGATGVWHGYPGKHA